MVDEKVFQGFSKKAVTFLRQLAKNNDREWFNEHKAEFDEQVLAPARAFVADMGARLRTIAPNINADPRINKSLFRLNRDTRFSADKTPYKTHLGIWMWEGEGKRMESSGFYFHLEPPDLMLGVGMHCLPKPFLPHFRDSIADPKKGPALKKTLDQIGKDSRYQMQGPTFKKVPRGYDPQHKLADLLKHDGLTVFSTMPIPEELYGPELIDFCFERYQDMAPLHRWMRAMAEGAAS